MENLNDRELIKEIKRFKCSPCIDILRKRHIGIIYKIYSRYSKSLYSFNFSNDDFNSEIDFLIFDAVRKFDLRRKNIKFSTWLAEQVRFFCLNKLNELNKNKTINSEPEIITKIIDDCFNSNDIIENKEQCDYLFSLLEQIKDQRVFEIFKLRYFNGFKNKMTWRDIGKSLVPPITNQTCINIHKKTVKFLKDKMTSNKNQDKI